MLQTTTGTPGSIDRLGFAALATAGICSAPEEIAVRMPEPAATNGLTADGRELRAMWIAPDSEHVWPSRPGLSAAELCTELTGLYTSAVLNNINAVFVAVRVEGDTVWAESAEPWSRFNADPQDGTPRLDVVQFMVEEAHRLNLEFHASVDLVAATSPEQCGTRAAPHTAALQPTWAEEHESTRRSNLAIATAREHLSQFDVNAIERYDVDGIHRSDNFYRFSNESAETPDLSTFERSDNPLSSVHARRQDQSAVWAAWFEDVPTAPRPTQMSGAQLLERRSSSLATLERTDAQRPMAEVREPRQQQRSFAQPTLIPAMERLPHSRLSSPSSVVAERTETGIELHWRDRGHRSMNATSFAIYRLEGHMSWVNTATPDCLVATVRSTDGALQSWVDPEPPTGPVTYVVTARDRVWNQSGPSRTVWIP